jgi:YidC/Oxa1 family membrane protein insertase
VKNYGIAIIILTILIKLLLSPLTHKSMISQQKMATLQPKIKDLQERFKGNPQQLNKETMDLYKREKINPFGGCLPMLLQLPILYAMYYLLNSMVQLKGANFLWIHDLASPDAIYKFHTAIPLMFFSLSSINILPFIMTVVQVGSSLLTQEGQSNKQANIMIWSMTIFMFVIFYNSSSGLVLYWTVMNILNLVQQFYVVGLKKKKALIS